MRVYWMNSKMRANLPNLHLLMSKRKHGLWSVLYQTHLLLYMYMYIPLCREHSCLVWCGLLEPVLVSRVGRHSTFFSEKSLQDHYCHRPSQTQRTHTYMYMYMYITSSLMSIIHVHVDVEDCFKTGSPFEALQMVLKPFKAVWT